VEAALTGEKSAKIGDFQKKKEPLVWKSENIGEENAIVCLFFYGASTLSTVFGVR
jgi:hypothetical protein